MADLGMVPKKELHLLLFLLLPDQGSGIMPVLKFRTDLDRLLVFSNLLGQLVYNLLWFRVLYCYSSCLDVAFTFSDILWYLCQSISSLIALLYLQSSFCPLRSALPDYRQISSAMFLVFSFLLLLIPVFQYSTSVNGTETHSERKINPHNPKKIIYITCLMKYQIHFSSFFKSVSYSTKFIAVVVTSQYLWNINLYVVNTSGNISTYL